MFKMSNKSFRIKYYELVDALYFLNGLDEDLVQGIRLQNKWISSQTEDKRRKLTDEMTCAYLKFLAPQDIQKYFQLITKENV